MRQVVTKSPKETAGLAKKILEIHKGKRKNSSIVFALEGEMGSGKTEFVRGLAGAMKLKEQIISPSFTLETEYGLNKLVHIDTWRMVSCKELNEIGFEKRLGNTSVIAVEWADKARDVIVRMARDKKIKVVWVRFEYGENEGERVISWELV